jgi:hypothetical protein
VSIGLEAEMRAVELANRLGHPPSRAFIADYGKRARAATRNGWADAIEQLVAKRAR